MTSYSWLSAVSGNWSTGSDWSPGGGPPTSSDTATISATGSDYTVDANSADDAVALTLSSANADLLIAGSIAAIAVGGAFTMSAGEVDIAGSGFAFGQLSVDGTFNLSGGTLNVNNGGALTLSGTLTETGGTINLNSGGSISGGTIASTAGTINWNGGTLSGVTYEGVLNLTSSGAPGVVANGMTMAGSNGNGPGAINVTGNSASLSFDNTQTFNNATITLGNTNGYYDVFYSTDVSGAGDQVLTLGSGVTIEVQGLAQISSGGQSGDGIVNQGVINVASASSQLYIQGGSFTNQGTINDAAGAGYGLSIYSTTFVNAGAIDVANGETLTIPSGTTFTNLASRTLTGGTYEVEVGSTFEVTATSTTSIATLDADVILSGTGSDFTQYLSDTAAYATLDSTLSTIGSTGELQLLNGRSWTTAGAAITNDGIINLGGGTITATATGSSLTDGTGSTLVGFGTVDATTFINSGMIEAKGGALTLHLSVTGSGASQIDGGADLIVAEGLGGAVNVAGDDATLQINTPASFSATLGGFSLGDTIFLPGVTATSASVNGSDQLVVMNGASTVATLQLDAAYANIYFLPVAVSGGTNIVALPVPATVAQYLALSADYDLIPGGFTISDTAANIFGNIGSLNDSQINSISATGGVVAIPVSTFAADQTTLDKVVEGFAISDTAQDLSNALSTLSDSHITSLIVSDSKPVVVNVVELTSDATQIALLINFGGGAASLAVVDTAANISADLDNLNGANIASITISDSNPITVDVAQLTSDATAIGKLVDANSAVPVSLRVEDSAQNVSGDLDNLNGSNIGSIVVSDNKPIGVSIAQIGDDAIAIGELIDANHSAATLAVSDVAANIDADLDHLNGSNISSITILDNNPLTVSVGQLTSDTTAISRLADANSSPYQLAVVDTAANVELGIGTRTQLSLSGGGLSLKGATTLAGVTVSAASLRPLNLYGATSVSGLTIAGQADVSNQGEILNR